MTRRRKPKAAAHLRAATWRLQVKAYESGRLRLQRITVRLVNALDVHDLSPSVVALLRELLTECDRRIWKP